MKKYEGVLLVLMALALGLAIWHGVRVPSGEPEVLDFTMLEKVPDDSGIAGKTMDNPMKNIKSTEKAMAKMENQQLNNVVQTILNRKSVRKYSDREVSEKDLILLARTAMAAPTARDSRPWYIFATNKKAEIEKLSEAYAQIGNAKALLIICGNRDKFLEGPGELYWMQDCAAATENALLAAESLGIGAVWLGICPNKQRMDGITKVLKLSDNLVPFSVISLGYPEGENQPKDKWDENAFKIL